MTVEWTRGASQDNFGSIHLVLQRARSVVGVLPRGARLPDVAWDFRHRKIVLFALIACGLTVGISLLIGDSVLLSLARGAIPALIALVAWKGPFGRRVSASLASASLIITASALLQASGVLEYHFLFFILVPVIALYEDWAPLATTLVLVLANYVFLALVIPTREFRHQENLDDPVTWALIRAALFLAMCATSIVHWRIHERARQEEANLLSQLASQALHDPLTGLANRTLLQDRLTQAVTLSERSGAPVMVLAVDIDGFKPVNDTYGHATGDLLLIELARRLESCIRAGDTAARNGGDEFILLLPGSGREEAEALAVRILAAMVPPVQLPQVELQLRISIGISVGAGDVSGDALLQEADQAMYSAKHNGRGGFVVFDSALTDEARTPLMVRPELARAWAQYTQTLRAEIASAKESGRLPEQTRGPETARRTLESLLAAIEVLPGGEEPARFLLPERNALEEFVFHHDLVQHWADALAADSIISATRSPEANLFWSELQRAATSQQQDHEGEPDPVETTTAPR